MMASPPSLSDRLHVEVVEGGVVSVTRNRRLLQKLLLPLRIRPPPRNQRTLANPPGSLSNCHYDTPLLHELSTF